ncbi:uncharacterized protein LOC126830342 [Patella vulgata]|uniref:uncharacterized protein LOC126830342 n=1 Tax=Patella vulgata TaxID=6465 RepID=UPI0024A9125E|nr:uncharacterized protein LOC126830342 [Patella vulgata]
MLCLDFVFIYLLCHLTVLKSVSTSFVDGNYKGNYDESKAQCEGLGLQVIKLETQKDIEELNNWMTKNKEIEYAWLGMRYIEPEFKWFDGTSLAVSNWDDVNDDEPDNLDTQHCAMIRQVDLKWDSRTCQSNFTAVCQTVTAVSDADNAKPSNETASDQTKGDTSVNDANQVAETQDKVGTVTEPASDQTKGDTAVQDTFVNDADHVAETQDKAGTVTEPTSDQTKGDTAVQDRAEAVTQSPDLNVRTIEFGVFAKNRYLQQTPLLSKSNTSLVQCAITCSHNTQCSYFASEASTCNLYQATVSLEMTDKRGSSIWKRS